MTLRERWTAFNEWAEPKVDASLLWLIERPWTTVGFAAIVITLVLFGWWAGSR